MGKKQVAVSLRKPPPADPDAFVKGGEAPPPANAAPANGAPANAAAPAAPRIAEGPTMTTKAGERREVTVYLPTELARKLSLRCLELDRDVSNVVTEALAGALTKEEETPEVVPVTLPADRWTRVRSVLEGVRAKLPLRFGMLV